MSKMIFVNLPVTDLARSTAFYQALGARMDERFCDSTASCMVFSDTIFAMLLTHEKFAQFTPKKIVEAQQATEVLLCLSEESRSDVDATVERALAAGGKEPRAAQDYGFMYNRSFEDPDGHIWEISWMDLEAAMAAGAEVSEGA